MKEGESPEKFILDLDIMREKLESLGEKISDERFLKDIISKLPMSKEEGQLCPYQLKRPEWTAKIGLKDDPLTVEELATELQQLYIQMYPKRAGEDGDVEDEEEEEEEEEVEGDRALAAYNNGQVKKKCFRCGDWGHLARKCPKVGASGGGQYSGRGYSGGQYSGGGQYQGNRYGQGFGGRASGLMNQQWRPREVRKCHHCGKLGHIKEYCWQLHGGPNTGGPNNTGRVSEQQMRNSENIRQQETTRERKNHSDEAGNVGQESKVDHEIVLHAGVIMELVKKGMMDIMVIHPEVVEVDEVVLSEEEFEVDEVVESIEEECPEELNVCEVEQVLVMKESIGICDDEDWWEAYLVTADATMCPIADIEEAKFAGGSTIKDEEQANNDSGWEVVKKKQKPRKTVKLDDNKNSVNLQKYGEKENFGDKMKKKEKKETISFNPTVSNNNRQVKS